MAPRPRPFENPMQRGDEAPSPSLLTGEAREQLVSRMKSELAAQPELMRGVSWTVVLSRMGYQLRAGPHGNTESAARAFAKSAPVSPLNTFLSHSWHASNIMKALALLQKHNGTAADIVGICSALAMASLDLAGLLPAWTNTLDNSFYNLLVPGGPAEVEVRAWSLVGFCLGRVATLLTWHWFDFGKRKERLFVDKLCIHQTDAELKQRAVKFIGHYLVETEEFLVMLDPTYLQRVWCVFELATFLGLNNSGTLVICPISLYSAIAITPVTVTAAWLILYSTWHLGLLPLAIKSLEQVVPGQLVAVIIFAPFTFGLSVVCTGLLRSYERSQRLILAELESFRLADAQCFLESDRAFVEEHVCELYGSVERFEAFAKESVQSKLQSLLGPSCEITFMMYLRAVALPHAAVVLDMVIVLCEAPLPYLLHVCLGGFFLCLLYAPFFGKLNEVCSEFSLNGHFSDKHNFAVACVAGVPAGISTCTVLGNIRLVMGQDILAKALFVVMLTLMLSIVWGRSLLFSYVLPCWNSGLFY